MFGSSFFGANFFGASHWGTAVGIDQGSGPTYFTAEVEVLGPGTDEAGIDHIEVEYL